MSACCGRRGALRVDDDELAVRARKAQALEQPRVRRDRVGAPHDDDLGAVAHVAERRRAGAARLEREAGRPVEQRARRVDRRADRVGERDRHALGLAGGAAQPVDERGARSGEDRGRLVERRLELRLAAVDAGERRRRRDAVGEPGVAEGARADQALEPAVVADDGLDVVADETAAGAGGARSGDGIEVTRSWSSSRSAAARASSPASTSSGERPGRDERADRAAGRDRLAGVRDVADAARRPVARVRDPQVRAREDDGLAGRAGRRRGDLGRQAPGARLQVRGERAHAVRRPRSSRAPPSGAG